MTDHDQIKEILEQVFEEKSRISSEDHEKHHEWVALRIESERLRIEVYKKILVWLAKWSVSAVFSYILYRLSNGHFQL